MADDAASAAEPQPEAEVQPESGVCDKPARGTHNPIDRNQVVHKHVEETSTLKDEGAPAEEEEPALGVTHDRAPDSSRLEPEADPAAQPNVEPATESQPQLVEHATPPSPTHVPTSLFRSSSLSQGFDVAESSCEQSLLITEIPRVQCTVESMSAQLEEYGDIGSIVVAPGHPRGDDDEVNNGCAILTFLLPESARRGRSAVLSVPDADHRDTPLTVAALKASDVRENPMLSSMLEQASKVRIDGLDAVLGNGAPPEKLVSLKDDLASCSGVEPIQIELYTSSDSTEWAEVMFKGPKEAVQCIRSHLEMRGKHGMKTQLRARALRQSDLMMDKEDPGMRLDTSSPADQLALHNSEGADISRLPSVTEVMRVNGVRKVTEWYAPGDRTTKHTSGPLIGTTEYEVSFMNTTPDTWVPEEWLGGVKDHRVMMLLNDMEERQQAANKFVEETRRRNKAKLKSTGAFHAAHFSVAMEHVAAAKAVKLSKGPQWSPNWPPFYLAEEVLREGVAGATLDATQEREPREAADVTGVIYHVRFSDSRKYWIPEEVMRLHMETWTLVEMYKAEAAAAAAIEAYIAEHPECVNMQRTDLIQHLRTVHGWQGGSALGRHRVGKLVRKILREQTAPRSSTSGVSRTRASARAREKSQQNAERERLHRRRLKTLPRSAIVNLEDSKVSSGLSYGDTLEMLGSTRHKWRHPAVLDDTPPIVSHGRLSQPGLDAISSPADEWMAEMGMTLQSNRPRSDLIELADRSTPNEEEMGNDEAFSSTATSLSTSSLPELSLPTVQLSRSAQEQFVLCETLTRQWEDEEASITTIRATNALVHSQHQAQKELRTELNSIRGAPTPIATNEISSSAEAKNEVIAVHDLPKIKRRKNRKRASGSAQIRDTRLYSRKYVANSAKGFQARKLKNTWPYTNQKTQIGSAPSAAKEQQAKGPEAASTALAIVEQAQHVQELPPLSVRLTNLLESGQQRREPLTTSPQSHSASYQSETGVTSGRGAGGIILRPQASTFTLAQSFFYVTAEGKRSEEVSATALPRLLQSGVLTSETLVCALGWPTWTPLAVCKDRLDMGGLLESHAADLETNKHGTDLARHPAGLRGVSNSSLIEAGYSWESLEADNSSNPAGGLVDDVSLPVSFADIGQSSLPRSSSRGLDTTSKQVDVLPGSQGDRLPIDSSITDASSVRHAHSDASLLRRGRLRCRQQTLAATLTRRQTAKGATASASLRVRGTPLSRAQRTLAVLVADGFSEDDAAWAQKKAGNGGCEEARDILLARLPERVPQYHVASGERTMVRQNPDGYTACESLEENFWRRRSYLNGGGETQLSLLGNASAMGIERAATPV